MTGREDGPMDDREGDRHPDRQVLHRHAEGGPREADAARRVEEHLEACARCREEVKAIREILRRAAELPRGIEPARDLWPGIESRVRAGGADAAGGERDAAGGPPATGPMPDLRRAAPWLAAAAAVLVALTAGATLWIAGGPGGVPDPGATGVASGPATDTARGTSAVLTEAARVEAGYRPMVDRLGAVLERRGDRLPPETREVVERNLRVIDAAIAEAESALARHPASPELLRALDRSYRQKIDLLRRSARLTAQM